MARQSGRRADYNWTGHAGFSVGFTTTQVIATGSILFIAAGTVVRIRGHASVGMDVGAADNAGAVALGLIIVKNNALVAGATAVPSPVNEIDAEWLWHGWFSLNSITGTQSDDEGGQRVLREIDTKAMRKFKADDALIMVADGFTLAGSPSYDMVYGIRVLAAD